MATTPVSGTVTVTVPLASVVPRDASVVGSITFALARGAEEYVNVMKSSVQSIAVTVAESPETVAVRDTGCTGLFIISLPVQIMILSLAATGAASAVGGTFVGSAPSGASLRMTYGVAVMPQHWVMRYILNAGSIPAV